MTADDRIRSFGQDFASAAAFRLSSDVAVLIWDTPAERLAKTKYTLAASRSLVPLVSMVLPRADGGQRVFWAMRPGSERELAEIAADGDILQTVVLEPVSRLPFLDLAAQLADLQPEGRLKFLNNLLTVWRSAFRLSRDEFFIGLVDDVIHALNLGQRPATVVCRLAQGRYLAETTVSSELGEINAIYALSADAVLPLPPQFAVTGRMERGQRRCHFVLETPRAPRALSLMIVGKRGIAIRELAQRGSRHPSLQEWWPEHGAEPGLREFVVRCLSEMPENGTALAIDLQLRSALPARKAGKSPLHPGAEIDLALALPEGLLVGGWTRDANGVLAGIDYLQEDGTALPIDGNWYEFPGWAHGAEEGSRTDVTGFVSWLPMREPLGALLQPRFQMRLASGAVKPLVPKPQPFDPATQRNRILRAVPPQHAIDAAFRTILAPALKGVEQRLGKTIHVDQTKDFGPLLDAPLVSIVVPLYRVLDFLRFQLSGLATDPFVAANAEIIYVLDSPEIHDETEHLLGGFHLLHGLSMKLVVMNRNGGYARACNAGARFARGQVVVMLNSDVVPCGPGWLETLALSVLRQKSIGAIGPKLLFEDGSLQHAGLYFARNKQDIWLNHHFFKGMPGAYPPAQEARVVPGVTGACQVMRREVWEMVGGYAEDFVIGDYEDSDLCLKIRKAGFDIVYEPAACLYHLERRSISRSQDYTRGVASQYNAWLHTERWNDDIAALMPATLGAEEAAAPSTRNIAARSAA
ncbi:MULTISPECIES: glycosyltransferase family 2 protein [unclassified Ensifer]|uniref:glycosyltransferase family 2 protein n=1 Tax=unclassified Ensifer TaxID=2633371 RepID=UPI0008137B93|nr:MULTISPECIES: glycosyltransferase family 2 protein [unclassified Ensifer]OCP03373.1 glycosyl transferase family 2 [Ensifer sp. LC14]OCP03705.1 glycosyl transferase family 2 [Ensifer sp. LC11]OCP03854.1 glycosyl transferase family 2 [Ensifer sp. LC13]OCP30268.1 glycosyl transferase family 2 [Ensifer sp. LC499]